MSPLHVFFVLLSAVPGVRWVLQAARDPKEQRSWGTVTGALLLTVVSTVGLLLVLYFECLV